MGNFLKRVLYFSAKWSFGNKHGSSYVLIMSADVSKEIIFLASVFSLSKCVYDIFFFPG